MDLPTSRSARTTTKWAQKAARLRTRIRDVAWDGAWYIRAFHDDGSLVGSATSHECAVDSIAQSWAVLARERGQSADNRALTSVLSADAALVREEERLVLLFWPPFDSALHDPGYVRAYPRGVRENGGQYTHAAAWLGFAHAALGDGTAAARIFDLLNPILRTRTAPDVARYRVEPYALAGDIYSCHPWVGRGGWTWYTGAAAWTWRLGIESILGLHQEEGALCVDPCIPASWKGFEAWVRRGAQTLHITVENPAAVSKGVAEITQNGALLASNRIDLDPAGHGTVEVHVRMSKDHPHAEQETPN
jgi:cyclic beta-1,2-glucan synthetase